MKTPRRILISRTDRLGDVLMSLHAVACVRKALPESAIDLLVRPEVMPVLEGLMTSWNVRLKEWAPSVDLTGYDVALCLFDEPTLLALLKKNGVALRVGNYSKLRSFFALTHGIRQRRALGKKSEGEYNLDLARIFLGVCVGSGAYTPAPITLPKSEASSEEALRALKKVGIAPGEAYWCAHPGMAGSALNLTPAGYVKLLDRLSKVQKGPLLLTLGPAVADLRLVEAIVEERPDWRVLPRVSLGAVGEVFRRADLVVAPSTGPLHLAHYVGATTLGVYSPVRSHQARRWAPWGGAGKSHVLAPDPACPGTKDCLGKRCRHFFCLDSLPAAPLPAPLSTSFAS